MRPAFPKHFVLVILALFAVPVFAAGCDEEDPVVDEGLEEEDDGAFDEGIYDEEFGVYESDEFTELENAALVGRRVTVSANVDRILEEGKAFVTGDEYIENGLLVVIPRATDVPALAEGDEVLVVGQVVDFVATDIEAGYEPFDLDDDLYGDWNDANALIAQTIIKAPGAVEVAPAPPAGATTTTTGAPANR